MTVVSIVIVAAFIGFAVLLMVLVQLVIERIERHYRRKYDPSGGYHVMYRLVLCVECGREAYRCECDPEDFPAVDEPGIRIIDVTPLGRG